MGGVKDMEQKEIEVLNLFLQLSEEEQEAWLERLRALVAENEVKA